MELSRDALAAWLRSACDARQVTITRLERMGGGAIQENWAVDAEVEDGPEAGSHPLVLRTSARAVLPVSWNRLQEFAILKVAHRAGAAVPRPWLACEDSAVIGQAFYLMTRAAGDG